MSLFVDLKYLRIIGSTLPLFKQKNDKLFNCRCIICGDSSKKKNKARGYFYNVKNDYLYKCHNCGIGMHFGSFLKNYNKLLYDQYVLERFTEGLPKNRPHQKLDENLFKMSPPVFNKNNILSTITTNLESLPKEHEAIQYCIKRKIPEKFYKDILYVSDVKKLEILSDKYLNKIKTNESRLVFSFFNRQKELLGVTCRGINNEHLRYLTVKINEESPFIYGLDKINIDDSVHVVEGPIDSLFLDNAIAVGGIGFNKLSLIDIDKESMIIILDNEPRNKEVCKIYNSIIEQNYKIVIWPQHLVEKDVNDMVIKNLNVMKIIKNNTFKGLEAKLKFIAWKRV
jgi:hypothetical protein